MPASTSSGRDAENLTLELDVFWGSRPGDLIYLQAPAENLRYYVRVVPKWVEAMKQAVGRANR